MEIPVEKRFALLSRVVEISNSNIQVENRLKFICDLLMRESGVDCVCMYRKEIRGEELTPWVSSCFQIEECIRFDFRIRPGEGVAGKAVQKRAPVFFPDVTETPPAPAVPGEMRDFRSILSIPIMDDVYLYGAMNLSHRTVTAFPEEQVAMLRVVATEAAGAIRNSRLYGDARKRVSELITLNEIGRAITSTFQVRDLLGYVAKTTSRLLQSDGCTIRLAGEKGQGALKVVVDEGYARSGMKRELRSTGKMLANQIVRERRPLLINGPEDSPMYGTLSRHGIFSFLGLPILSKGKALGVINYYSCSPRVLFDIEVMQLTQTVCSQLANMIENSSMFREAQQIAQENQVRARRFSTLYAVARALMSTVRTDRLLQVTLGALTSPSGLNFSRAILFLLSEDGKYLVARMGREAGRRKGAERRRRGRDREEELPDWAAGKGERQHREEIWTEVDRIRIPVAESCLVAKSVLDKKPVRTGTGCPAAGDVSGDGFCGNHHPSFASVPLLVKGEARGAIYVDNRSHDREISEEDIQILTMFASEVCLALENASLVERLEGALSTVRLTQDRLLQSEKLAALGEMAARIAHEIKNPLTVIGGFSARMARKESEGRPDRAAIGRYAKIILKEVQRLERIVQETLYFSREAAPSFRPVDLHAEVREVLSMFTEELEESGIVRVTDLAADPPVVSVDPDQIRQVLWNLVANAVQAMADGGTLTVATRSAQEEEGEGLVLLVGDTGGGIPHDAVHNIFNPFFTTKSRGTGLGLPIVHAIVQKHGGTIHLDNREGEGVTFSIFLPREPKGKGTGGRILEQM
ncbi:MAG TPA: GAF domain-containing protein, partial [Candidatus Deferrimicrobiaceae bacterium]